MEHARHTRNRFFFKHINAYLHSHLSGARTFYPYPYDHLLETESTCLKIDEVTIGRSLSTGTLPPTEKRRIYKTLKRGTTASKDHGINFVSSFPAARHGRHGETPKVALDYEL